MWWSEIAMFGRGVFVMIVFDRAVFDRTVFGKPLFVFLQFNLIPIAFFLLSLPAWTPSSHYFTAWSWLCCSKSKISWLLLISNFANCVTKYLDQETWFPLSLCHLAGRFSASLTWFITAWFPGAGCVTPGWKFSWLCRKMPWMNKFNFHHCHCHLIVGFSISCPGSYHHCLIS